MATISSSLKSKPDSQLSPARFGTRTPAKRLERKEKLGERRQEKRPLAEDSPLCSDKGRRGSDWKCCGFACFLRDMLVGTSADQE